MRDEATMYDVVADGKGAVRSLIARCFLRGAVVGLACVSLVSKSLLTVKAS